MEEEKSLLASLPPARFVVSKISTRKVYHDSHIYVDYNYYSVPYAYVGKTVGIEITETLLKVFYKNQLIALHKRRSKKGEFSTINSHYPDFKIFARDIVKCCGLEISHIPLNTITGQPPERDYN